MNFIRFFIDRPLVTNLLLLLVAVAGVLGWRAMPEEMFPVVEKDVVRITTDFPGATPAEVERQVTQPIEEAFDGLAGVDAITSVSYEGRSQVQVRLKPGTDVEDFLRKAQNALDRIDDLPEEAEDPEMVRLETRFPVISLSLYGDVDRGTLFALAREVKRRLLALPGVASVGVAGDRKWELHVEADPRRLAFHGVPLSRLAAALRAALPDLPGGTVEAPEGDILLRGRGAPPTVEAIEALPVRDDGHGGELRIGDLARVRLALEPPRTLGHFNGKPSVNLTVTKTATASTLAVSAAVRGLVRTLRASLPPAVHVGLFSDLSVYVKRRLETVKSSGVVGLVLLLAALYLTLNFRIALVTAMGIPVAFLVAAATLHALGYTINMVSLFAFLIALGLVVDDAIIVNENIYRHMENGAAPRVAAEAGAREVFWPVVVSTLTTIAAFLPMFAIGGVIGAFIRVIPVVVSAALLGSLAEAFVVLPSHANDLLRLSPPRRRRFAPDWRRWLESYLALLDRALRHRYYIAVLFLLVLALALAWAATRLPYEQFGHVDIGQFFVNVEAPETYSLQDTERLASAMEQVVFATLTRDELDTLLTNIGVTFIDFNRSILGSRYLQFIVDLKKPRPRGFIERFVTPLVNLRFDTRGTRERTTAAIIDALRARLQQVPGVMRLSILRPQGGPAGPDIEVGVVGPEIAGIRRRAEAVRDFLARIPGVHDVRQDLDTGKLEYRYRIKARGRALGITQEQVARAVRTGFLGLKVVEVGRGQERLPVRLRFDAATRADADLADLPLVLDDGRTLYLGDVAEIEIARGLDAIRRRNGARLATVTADVDSELVTPDEVIARVRAHFPRLADPHGTYHIEFLGEKKEASESLADARRAMVLALALIFFLLAALFGSLLDPFVVMLAIPFGMIGVILGHALFGMHLQFLSVIGFLALTGIVVNDSLILVDFIRRLRAAGLDRFQAVREAGRVRIRPILLTTLTTFLGVSPLIFFATGQTAFLSPMAVSLGFGLVTATLLILVLVPCFYLIADDLRTRLGRAPHAASNPVS
ncbi:MAG: efflux RND transporter permease subunit [Gammaproteobacteria bacterium]|nr:MAG: efflux RND transporter permease subunit [Gammaproteobacteria bacterium]